MGQSCNPLCRRCWAEEETSIHVLWEGEALALLSRVHLGSFLLDPEDLKSLSLGAFWNFNKGFGLPRLDIILLGTKDPSKGLGASGSKRLEPSYYSLSGKWTNYQLNRRLVGLQSRFEHFAVEEGLFHLPGNRTTNHRSPLLSLVAAQQRWRSWRNVAYGMMWQNTDATPRPRRTETSTTVIQNLTKKAMCVWTLHWSAFA